MRLRLINEGQYRFIKFARANGIEYADATKGLDLADGSVEVLYSSHMFEHLDREEAKLFLKEAKRVLMPGGIIRLAVPDISSQVSQYMNSGDADEFVAGTCITRPRPRTLVQRVGIILTGTRHHQWMYDGRSLCRVLAANGFAEGTVVPAGTSMISDPGNLDLWERQCESVYVEAVRI